MFFSLILENAAGDQINMTATANQYMTSQIEGLSPPPGTISTSSYAGMDGSYLNNAFVHNMWVIGDAPMFTAYEDRIEIVSLGTLPPNQTKEGFFGGVSIPVNQKLSEILLQLHISEKSGRGVPRITAAYGEEAFQFKENAISVTIPFARLNLGKTTQDTTQDTIQDISDKADVLNRILVFCKNAHSTKEITDHLGFKERVLQNIYVFFLIRDDLRELFLRSRIVNIRSTLRFPNKSNNHLRPLSNCRKDRQELGGHFLLLLLAT